MTRESIVADFLLHRASQSPLFDMFEGEKATFHKSSSQHASAYIKFAIPSKIPLSTMKELVKNTVRYVSFDEILLERVVNKAILLGRKCEKSFAYNAPGLRDAVYLRIKYTTGGVLRFSMDGSLYATDPLLASSPTTPYVYNLSMGSFNYVGLKNKASKPGANCYWLVDSPFFLDSGGGTRRHKKNNNWRVLHRRGGGGAGNPKLGSYPSRGTT